MNGTDQRNWQRRPAWPIDLDPSRALQGSILDEAVQVRTRTNPVQEQRTPHEYGVRQYGFYSVLYWPRAVREQRPPRWERSQGRLRCWCRWLSMKHASRSAADTSPSHLIVAPRRQQA